MTKARNNQTPITNNQTMTNNQIQITKQGIIEGFVFGDWLLNFGICLVIVS